MICNDFGGFVCETMTFGVGIRQNFDEFGVSGVFSLVRVVFRCLVGLLFWSWFLVVWIWNCLLICFLVRALWFDDFVVLDGIWRCLRCKVEFLWNLVFCVTFFVWGCAFQVFGEFAALVLILFVWVWGLFCFMIFGFFWVVLFYVGLIGFGLGRSVFGVVQDRNLWEFASFSDFSWLDWLCGFVVLVVDLFSVCSLLGFVAFVVLWFSDFGSEPQC